MVGISLLTLVLGEVGGAETYARGLCRGLARAGTLDYTAFTPPAAPGAGGPARQRPVGRVDRVELLPETRPGEALLQQFQVQLLGGGLRRHGHRC